MRRIPRKLILLALVLLGLRPGEALANDGILAQGNERILAIGALLVLLLYLLPIIAVEAAVVSKRLWISYGRSFLLMALANVASTGFGLVCRLAGAEPGWKSAWSAGDPEHAVVLLLRSFLVTVALEAWLLLIALKKEKDPAATMYTTVVANFVSYVVMVALMTLVSL